MSQRLFAVAVTALLLAGLLVHAAPAGGQDPPPPLPDAIPTWWHEAAGLTPLLTAPPPPNPATICVIDTGVTPTPDLDITARWAYDGGTLDDVRATEDSPGHGTLVAHFAAGKVNGWGGAGAFPHARISSVRVFPHDGGAAWQDYIRAITRCVKLDPATKVIVIALGGSAIGASEAYELEDYVGHALDLYDINVLAAAGNHGGEVDYPARFGASLAVAAHDARGILCGFASRGPEVDLAAPGCDLSGFDHLGMPWALDGTSFAVPIVAGAVAAVRSHAPNLSAREVETILLRTAVAGDPPRVDAARALDSVGVSSAPVRSGTPEAPAPKPVPAGIVRVRETVAPPRPRVRVRHRGRSLAIRALNRPAGAWFEVRIGPRRIRRTSSRIWILTTRRRGRCRFSTTVGASRWTSVRW